MLPRLEAIKDTCQRKGATFGNSYLQIRSGRDFWSKLKAVAPFEIRGVQIELGTHT
ncbi:MAG: hypothetical protein RMI63_09085 [Caldimicrobium sp.]|nr:hypothetical protein [Caldimicrobium sp.]